MPPAHAEGAAHDFGQSRPTDRTRVLLIKRRTLFTGGTVMVQVFFLLQCELQRETLVREQCLLHQTALALMGTARLHKRRAIRIQSASLNSSFRRPNYMKLRPVPTITWQEVAFWGDFTCYSFAHSDGPRGEHGGENQSHRLCFSVALLLCVSPAQRPEPPPKKAAVSAVSPVTAPRSGPKKRYQTLRSPCGLRAHSSRGP